MTADAAEIVRLAERVEQATGPDADLDAEIEVLLRNYAEPGLNWRRVGTSELIWNGTRYSEVRSPSYTGSVDAALTLLPGFWCKILAGQGAKAEVGADGVWKPHASSWAATPSLALTAAALRARAASALSDGEG